jgi:PleD family two-component response regulator
MTLRDFLANVYGGSQQRKTPPDNNAEPVRPRQPRRDRRRADGRRRLDKRSSVVPRVLLVEPHDDTRALYTTLFEDAGFAVYAVSSGRAAIAIAHQRLPDVVVMEIGVPDADGFAILQELRREPGTADVPAVVVTSHSPAPRSCSRNR